MAGHLTSDHPDQCSAVGRGQEQDVVCFDALVARIEPLVGRREVDPELNAVEQPSAGNELVGGPLDVQDARPRRHPLRRAVRDEAASTDGVLMLEGAVDHVGHGLEAPMGVPGRALGFAGGVLHLAHLVHVDEGVELGDRHAGEGAPYRETFAFETTRGVRDALHRADARGARPASRCAGAPGCRGRSLQAWRTHSLLRSAHPSGFGPRDTSHQLDACATRGDPVLFRTVAVLRSGSGGVEPRDLLRRQRDVGRGGRGDGGLPAGCCRGSG